MTEQLGEAVIHVGADTTDVGKQVADGVQKGVSSASRSLSQLGADTQKLGKKLSLSLTAPLTGIAGFAIKTQAAYEQTMNVLAANTDATAGQMDRLDKLAKQLGADTVFSAGEAGDAMLELAKGGFKPAEIAGGGVQAVMALAATEGIDLAEAATIAGNAMNTFGLEAKNASQIADALAGGSMSSSASVASLAQALQQVGPGARNAGLTLQDTVGVLASFASAGIQGSDAGTSLKTMLARLVPQTKKAREEMKKLGIDFTNSDGSIKSITEVAGILRARLGKLSQEQRTTALATIFGSDATRAATVLMNQGTEGIKDYISETKKQGTAQKLADARMKGTAGAIEKMKGSVETAALALGEALAPAVIKVAGVVQDLTDGFTNLSPEMQTTVAVLGAAVAAAGPLLFIGGSLIRTIGTLGTGFASASTALSTFSTNMTTAEGRTKNMQGTMTKLGGAARGAAGIAGLGALTLGAKESGTAIGALSTVAGGALSGFAAGGPIGGFIGAGAALLFTLKDAFTGSKRAAKDAEQANYDYRKSLDETTGAISRMTKEQVRNNLILDGGAKSAAALGIPMRDAIGFITGNEAAIKRVNTALKELANTKGNKQLPIDMQATASSIVNLQESLGINSKALAQNRREVAAASDDYKTWGKVLRGVPAEVVVKLRQQGFDPSIKQLRRLQEEYKLTPRQLNTIIRETGSKAVIKNVEGVTRVMRDVGKVKPDTGKYTLDLLSAIDGTTTKVRPRVRNLAKAMTEPVEKAQPNFGPFENSIFRGLNKVEGVAASGGQQIGGAMKAGVLRGFSGTSNSLAALAAQSVTAAINAAKRAGDIQSPSKKMAYVGQMLGEGGPAGMKPLQKQWASAGAQLTAAALSGASGGRLGAVSGMPVSSAVRPLTPARATAGTPAPGFSWQPVVDAIQGLPTGAGSDRPNLTIEMNNYGPVTSADKRREVEWLARFGTGLTPAEASENVA